MSASEIGIIGMGVMGRSLAKNAAGKGIRLSVYNRMTDAEKEVIPTLLQDISRTNIQGFHEIEAFISSLSQPRKMLLMIPAGAAVDGMIKTLLPLLSEGDIIMDGGNSHYKDTQHRYQMLSSEGIHFMGVGISGGEKGALQGPSMMIGGNENAYEQLKPFFDAIAATDKDGNACATYVGGDGCGHLVKTIHNGIEYAEMQLLAECYDLLKPSHTYDRISEIFMEWNESNAKSYLLEITGQILQKKDKDGSYLIDKVLDKAGSKGTGSWSSQIAFQLGVPAPMINAAVTARYLSSLKEKRASLSSRVENKDTLPTESLNVEELKKAYTFARILNHYQGFEIIKAAAKENDWNINLSEIARIWTEGCIIKSRLMESLVPIFQTETDLVEDLGLFNQLKSYENSVKNILNYGFNKRLLINCMSNSYNYFVSLTTALSSAHIIQAQRDEFGAHTYRRIDTPEDQSFTSNWTTDG